jgi:catalase
VGGLAEDAVEAINAVYGCHRGERVSHAKGIVCSGTFTAAPAAASLTTAEHMQGPEVRAVARFSNSSGDPGAPDFDRDVRGMATTLFLPSGARTDIVAVTMPCFVARTPREFVEFTRATVPSRLRPFRVARYLIGHREAWRATRARLGIKRPASYATCRFDALHTFRWVDGDGRVRPVRYVWTPHAGEASIRRRRARQLGADYLRTELRERLRSAPVRFDLQLRLARDGDAIDDSTRPWPADRESVTAGTLEISRIGTGRQESGDELVFDPTRVTAGIELTDDPILRFRPEAYVVSFERRTAAQGR